ncbi:MAG: 2,3-bisphosphoglycerate-independent phosphoglycerate mutase [Endomicrobiales bacterium]|nr:2,3-bisphosphoglycerate-independent phosphoglycerate mutase [Endomicrobiales bacterium]
MITQEFLRKLVVKNEKKIVLLVFDGLGGLPNASGKTELEVAKHPNLDRLVQNGICGFTDPIAPGITPGSGPAHVSLFGYDPLKYEIGRGLLDTLGIDFEFTNQDMAARGNFATKDDKGIITDRRAGRIPTETCNHLCNDVLKDITIDGIKTFVMPVKEHRFSVIFRGANLCDRISDTDPQKEGLKPLPPQNIADDPKGLETGSKQEANAKLCTFNNAKSTISIVSKFIEEANKRLKNEHPANTILLRGFSKMIDIPNFNDVYQLNSAAIAIYPMYRGLARLVGMNVLKTGTTIESEFETLKENFGKFDFFFMHIKETDSAGEDGDFERKVKAIEETDKYVSKLIDLKPDVVVVTGDHSTPALWHGHSWHPVPTLLYSQYCRRDSIKEFGETNCLSGAFGRQPAQNIMALAMANAGKLKKYGA